MNKVAYGNLLRELSTYMNVEIDCDKSSPFKPMYYFLHESLGISMSTNSIFFAFR